jgi:phosphatidylserine decarboxylase
MKNNNNNNNYKSFVVKLSLWAQGKGVPGASPAWLTRIARAITLLKNPRLTAQFIRTYGIDHTQATRCASSDSIDQCASKYGSLSNFFTRNIKNIHIDTTAEIVSPATCKAMLFDGFHDSKVWVKGRRWSASRLLRRQSVHFEDYSLGIFRLRPKDYHRFHAPIAGRITHVTAIQGGYLSVDPVIISSRNVLTENTRVVIDIDHPRFGSCSFVAIGAAGVGHVRVFVSKDDFITLGQQLGYFDFGGSTVILMIPSRNHVRWIPGIRTRSLQGKETYVDVGTSLVH